MDRLEIASGGWDAPSDLVDLDWGAPLLALLKLLTLAALCIVYLSQRRRSRALKASLADLEERARGQALVPVDRTSSMGRSRGPAPRRRTVRPVSR